jgi:hypothetical protein
MFVDALITQLFVDYPILVKALLFMSIARLVFKPLMMAIEQKVRNTEDLEDDAKLKRFKSGYLYLLLTFLLDLTTSIKLPKK